MDAYTKAVLTVIAAALCAIVLQNAGVGSAVAQNRVPAPVTICNESGSHCGLGSTEGNSLDIYGHVY